MNPGDRLALVADTHSYQAGLSPLLSFFQRQGVRHLACLGDCNPEPFRPWLQQGPEYRLYWIFDVNGPEMPEATRTGLALELAGGVYLAHTRSTLWSHFKDRISAQQANRGAGRPPMLLCHGHTHVPSVTLYTPPVSKLLYINDAVRPQQFQARQACLSLAPDSIYLIVPGAFTLEEGRFPAFSFAVLDLAASRLVMVSLKELASLESIELFPV
jgi:predicted phosphodiesterase